MYLSIIITTSDSRCLLPEGGRKKEAGDLRGLRDLDGLLVDVEVDVVLAHEDVAKDPERAVGGGDVDGKEAKHALRARLLEDDVLEAQGKVLAAESEGDRLHIGRARDDELLAEDGGRAELLSEGLNLRSGASEGGCARVDDGLLGRAHGSTVVLDIIELDLPVGLAGERDGHEVAGVVGLVRATEEKLAIGLVNQGEMVGKIDLSTVRYIRKEKNMLRPERTEATHVVAEVERERVLGKLAGSDESVDRGRDVVDGDGIPAKAEDAIELADAVSEAKTSRVVDLSEEVVVERVVADLDVVARVEAGDGARAVLDLELSAVSLVGRRLGVVVDLVGGEELHTSRLH